MIYMKKGNRITKNPTTNRIAPKIRDNHFSFPETPFHKTTFTKKRAFFLSTKRPMNIINTPIKMVMMISIPLHLQEYDNLNSLFYFNINYQSTSIVSVHQLTP